MNALKYSYQEKTLELSRLEIPEINDPTEILIKVAFTAICGTDLNILAGNYPCRQTLDTVTLGHEIAGVVAKLGRDVINFLVGDRVIINPNNGCQKCAFCQAGTPQFCKIGCLENTIGIYKDGGWAEYVLCPEEQVYKLTSKIPLEIAVLAEPLSCLIHGWDVIAPVSVGSKILLLGAGIMGYLWACALHLQGHRDVTVSEPTEAKLKHMKRLNTGFKMVSPSQLEMNIKNDPEKYQFDVVIDCSGSPEGMEQGMSVLNFGGKFCVFGVAPPKSKINIKPFDIFWKELKIFGVKTNPFTFKKAIGLLEAMGDRYLNYTILGMKTFGLSEYQEAITSMKNGTIIKAVFKIV